MLAEFSIHGFQTFFNIPNYSVKFTKCSNNNELLKSDGVLSLLVAVARELSQRLRVPEDQHQGEGRHHADHAEPDPEKKLESLKNTRNISFILPLVFCSCPCWRDLIAPSSPAVTSETLLRKQMFDIT